MNIVVSEEARAHIAQAGGVLYVRSRTHRCCTGQITMLEAATEAPRDLAPYRTLSSGSLTVLFAAPGAGPAELAIELRGRRRKRPVAYWDGCALRP
ncbi:MAG TPA: hypothetical protein VN781_02430 [Acidimicrobiales bacterium]|nr:hypothetical protein [Acidimicrobiales bacterium]